MSASDPEGIPGLALTEPPQAFAAPWQAQAFALAVALHQAGVFTWSEWAAALGAERARNLQDDPDAYYTAWLAALEQLTAARGLASPVALSERKQAWADAYQRTPHGQPVAL